MHLKRIKTDSADAKSIAEYRYEYQHKLSFFKIKDKAQIAVDNLIKVIDDLQQQKTMTNNQYHAIQKQPNVSNEWQIWAVNLLKLSYFMGLNRKIYANDNYSFDSIGILQSLFIFCELY